MRMEQVLETASAPVENQIQSAYAELQAYYDVNREDIDRRFMDLFQQLFSMGVTAQQNGKGAISYLAVSHLYSSLITGTGEFILALYDDRLYFDDDPINIYWSPVFLWEQFNRDMEEIERALKGRLTRLKKYELDAVKTEYAERFFEIGHKMFADYTVLIISMMENSSLKITPGFAVIYGGYLDTATVLWKGGET